MVVEQGERGRVKGPVPLPKAHNPGWDKYALESTLP